MPKSSVVLESSLPPPALPSRSRLQKVVDEPPDVDDIHTDLEHEVIYFLEAQLKRVINVRQMLFFTVSRRKARDVNRLLNNTLRSPAGGEKNLFFKAVFPTCSM